MPLCHIEWHYRVFEAAVIWRSLAHNSKRLGIDHARIEAELRNTAIAIDTRARILRAVVDSAKNDIEKLLNSVTQEQLHKRMARVNDEVVYGTLLTLDAFFFESLSLYELVKKFYVALLRGAHLLVGREAHEDFDKLVCQAEAQVEFNWRSYLESNRNLFGHQAAPYLAVEFSEENGLPKQLVFESEPDQYLRLPEFDKVLRGLEALRDLCTADLTKRLGSRRHTGRT